MLCLCRSRGTPNCVPALKIVSPSMTLYAGRKKGTNQDDFDNDISARSFTNSLRANFIDYDNVIICSNDNLATDNGQV